MMDEVNVSEISKISDTNIVDKKPKKSKEDVTRRKFIAGLAGTGAASAAAYWFVARDSGQIVAKGFETPTDPVVNLELQDVTTASTLMPNDIRLKEGLAYPGPVKERILVLIELQGGNDGASTVVPYGDSKYYDLRPNLGIAQEDVLAIDDYIGLNPALADLYKRQLAVVEGVGNTSGSLSHFTNQKLWYSGGGTGSSSGYLAQLADCLKKNQNSPGLLALSAVGYAPQLNGIESTQLSLTNVNQLNILKREDYIYPKYHAALKSFSGGPFTTEMSKNWNKLFSLSDDIPGVPEIEKENPMIKDGGTLGKQLWVAADFIKSGAGTRVIHAKLGGFDTHTNHKSRHANLMKQVNAAVNGFLSKIDEMGMTDRVLVALTSEFGRRAKENGPGFDHGNGSTLMVFGPVVPGRHGVANKFNNLDDRGNLKTQVPYDSYLRTLSKEWLGCEEILPESEPLVGLI